MLSLILDKNGILFGRNSTTNVGSIIASTGDLANTAIGTTDAITLQNLGAAPNNVFTIR